jgi:hypothetical protein
MDQLPVEIIDLNHWHKVVITRVPIVVCPHLYRAHGHRAGVFVRRRPTKQDVLPRLLRVVVGNYVRLAVVDLQVKPVERLGPKELALTPTMWAHIAHLRVFDQHVATRASEVNTR